MRLVHSLQFLAKTVITQTLVDHTDTIQEYRDKALYIIRQLNTNQFTAVSGFILQNFVEKYPKFLTDELLYVLAPPHIKTLQLAGLTVGKDIENMGRLFRKCCKIQTLELDGCEGVINLDLCYLISKTLTQLTSVAMESCPPITDEHVQFLLLYCPTLTNLNISWNELITDQVFNLGSLSTRSSPRRQKHESHNINLASVDVSGCKSLTSNCVRYLTMLCGSKLHTLNVSWTQMDTSILWYLSGYNLATVVQLAVSQDGQVLDRNRQEEKLISDLIQSQKNLEKRIEEMDQSDDSEDEILEAPRNLTCDEKVGEMITKENASIKDVNQQHGGADITEEKDDANKHTKSSFEISGQSSHSKGHSGEEIGQKQTNLFSQDAMNEYLEKSCPATDGVTTETNIIQIDPLEKNDSFSPGVTMTTTGNIGSENPILECLPGDKEMSSGVTSTDKLSTKNSQHMSMKHKGLAMKSDTDNTDILKADKVDLNTDDSSKSNLNNPSTSNVVMTTLNHEDIDLEMSVTEEVKADAPGTRTGDVKDNTTNTQTDDVICDTTNIQADDVRLAKLVSQSDDVTRSKTNSQADAARLKTIDTQSDDVIGSKMNTQSDDVTGSKTNSHADAARLKTIDTQSDDVIGSKMNTQIDDAVDKTNTCTDAKSDEDIPKNDDTHSIATNNDDHSLATNSKESTDSSTETTATQAVERTQVFQPNMTSLDISNITLEHPITDSALRDFFTANKKMRKFSISWSKLNNFTLEFITNNAPEMRTLSLVDCESLSSAGIVCLSKCRKLEQLDLKGVSFISDAGLTPLLANSDSALTKLCLAEANITDVSMHRIGKYFGPKIKDLDISWCEEVTDNGISAVVKSCTSLESLSLRQCPATDDTLMTMADKCVHLSNLNLCGVEELSDTAVTVMVSRFHYLQKIDLSWNANLSNTSITMLLSACTLLETAILCGLKSITSKPFFPIIADLHKWRRCQALLKVKLRERKVLKESGDPQLSSDEEFEDLFVPHRSTCYAAYLKYIDLEYCNQVNDDALAEVVAVCRGTLYVRDYYGQQLEPKLLKFKA